MNKSYIIPFIMRPVRIGQGYNTGSHKKWPEDKEDFTYSIDFLLKQGTRVIASREGTVVKVKTDGTKNYSGKDSVKGEEAYKVHMNEIVIKHDDGTFASYAHLKNHTPKVRNGQKVMQGQVIGLSGNTGWSSAPHLDFTVFRKHNKGWKVKSIKVNFLDYTKKIR